MSVTTTLSVRQARRLALARAGLLRPERTGLPDRAAGRGARARARCHAVIERFGYLQLDSIAVAGARTHAIVLASRLKSLRAQLAESLLRPGEPLFEYWAHEACWVPLSLYPAFGFRRREYRVHPWWGDVITEHAELARAITRRVEAQGPIRSADLEGDRVEHMWGTKLATRVAEALWLAGVLAVRERSGFQRTFDLTERVIPETARRIELGADESMDALLLKALEGHGWATTGTLGATWRLANRRQAINASLARLQESGDIVPCTLQAGDRAIGGWIRPADRELAEALEAIRPRPDRGILLSPFDPVLWDRARTLLLFDFEQVLEVYKPASRRRYGYYCLPVLAGDHLVARVDLKAERKRGQLLVLSCHLERPRARRPSAAGTQSAVASALQRFAESVALELDAAGLEWLR